MKKRIGVFSFFAGAGFLDLGFEDTGDFETVFVNEYHKPFLNIYKESRKNLKIKPPIHGYHDCDITEFLLEEKTKLLQKQLTESRSNCSLVGYIGGPPCPDFSVGGKNRGKEGENGKLSGTYIELICRNKPDFFLFENVKGLYRTTKHREFFESMKLKLISSGYYLTEKLINALEYGAPQDRDRIILIGFKRDVLTNKGIAVNGSPIIQDFNWDSNIIYNRNEVLNKPWPKKEIFIENSEKEFVYKVPKKLTVEYWFKKNEIENHPNSIHFFKPKAGLKKFQIIEEGDDLKKSYKRLHRWRYSPTAAYGNNEVHLHPYKARRLTAAEALAVQSLPKNFVIPEDTTLTNMFKAIGNGVPYLAAKGLALTISTFISEHTEKTKYEKANCE